MENQTHFNTWDYLFTELADPRTTKWFLLKDPIQGLTIIGLYLFFILKWGPNYMKDKKPYNLRYVLIVYNLIQVLFSTYLFLEGLDGAWLHYSWKCEPVDFSNSPAAMRVARGVYLYFIAKITELLDTVFFVLKKNDRQITFLHLYHHVGMMMISWGVAKYYPGGHGTFSGVLNCFVHIIMYSYYLLSAFGPDIQKYLWWKKYITTLQMGQFIIAFLHNAQLFIYECGYPKFSMILTLPNAIFFFYMFHDFYQAAYRTMKPKKTGK